MLMPRLLSGLLVLCLCHPSSSSYHILVNYEPHENNVTSAFIIKPLPSVAVAVWVYVCVCVNVSFEGD